MRLKTSSTLATPAHAAMQALGSAAAVGAIVGLLLAFQGVVRAGVSQGESRRQASSARADALWRCNTLADRSLRESCLEALKGSPRAEAIAVIGTL
jgi:hypothetical protein